MAELNGVPVDTEALQTLALVNYGHFTSIRVEQGQVRGLPLHLDRLSRDCQALFGTDIDRNRVRSYIRQVVDNNPAEVMNVRVTVFDSHLELGTPGWQAEPQFLVTCRSTSPLIELPAIRVQSAEYSRETPYIKHVGLYSTIRLRRQAQQAGFDDVLFTDSTGRISEGATWNVGFFDGERVVWPEAEVLDGITMQLIRQVHPDFVIQPVELASLSTMQAAFATNVSIGVRPIKAINEMTFDEDHSIVATLRAEYLGIKPEVI